MVIIGLDDLFLHLRRFILLGQLLPFQHFLLGSLPQTFDLPFVPEPVHFRHFLVVALLLRRYLDPFLPYNLLHLFGRQAVAVFLLKQLSLLLTEENVGA